jgi:NAD(P)-dependent dehydrogenase (short-subunit alcohol dehydrogenase family)
MATVMITGTNRGLGLEFVKQYAEAGWRVLACCREPDEAVDLKTLAIKHLNIKVLALDVADFVQIDALALELRNEQIDILINNAGIYPSSGLGKINYEDWATAFKVNSMAPLKMVEAFTPHVASSSLKKIATLSSKMGSLDDNTSGGSYLYRSSKTAVNMVMKSLSIDLKVYDISVVTLHPGWVQTDMGGPNGLIDTATSVKGMCRVIADLAPRNSGKFIAYDGKEIAW